MADSYVLGQVPWEYFCTLTYPDPVPGSGVRAKMGFAFLYEAAHWYKRPFGQLLWALREEPGELKGRLHFHMLLASGEDHRPSRSGAFALEARWRWVKGGHPKIVPYGGIVHCEYIQKPVRGPSAGNLYELDKFNFALRVEWSKSLTRRLERNARKLVVGSGLEREVTVRQVRSEESPSWGIERSLPKGDRE